MDQSTKSIAKGVLLGMAWLILVLTPTSAVGAWFGGVIAEDSCYSYSTNSALRCAAEITTGTIYGSVVGLLVGALIIALALGISKKTADT